MDLRERFSTPTTRHPWETVRAGFFSRVLADPRSTTRPLTVLDVGAGDGFVASQLLDALPPGSSLACVDAEYTEDHLAALRAEARPGMSFHRACPDGSFDAIVMLDVLEHVADDRAFLEEIVAPRLASGGLLLASVPAHQALYTQHDVALGHHRRYSASGLRDVLVAAGLIVRRSGSLFGSLIVPRAIEKSLERARGIRSRPATNGLAAQITTAVSAWSHGPVVTGLIRGALEIDARLCELASRLAAPSAGLSVWALCERR